MLLQLSIRDFVIVQKLELEFRPGFTALTGETGAGKSILIDALTLALGGRADADQVRAGAERAEVSAEFSIQTLPGLQQWLAQTELQGDPGQLLLRRVVDRNGRSRALINGHVATAAQLREAASQLLDIHGQHAHQSLLRPSAQREMLDARGELSDLCDQTGQAWRAWRKLVEQRELAQTQAAARAVELERISWQMQELERLAPEPGEWERVGEEQTRLANAAGLMQAAQSAAEAIAEGDGAALSLLAGALSSLREMAEIDRGLAEMVSLIESAEVNLQEAAQSLRRYGDRVELDPARLSTVEQRLDALHAAARRFRTRPESLPALLAETRQQLAALEAASDAQAMQQQELAAHQHYSALAQRLSDGRAKAATRFGREVTAAMKELALGGGRFEVSLQPIEGGAAQGNETVEFLVSANPGVEPRPLAKVASGGELSRISLAIQVIASAASAVPSMIFDEVDAGIGGAVAEVVGRKLSQLARSRQVLCVTHLPQVAALADQQWSVSKSGNGDSVQSKVTPLDAAARVEEIARMLGGVDITPTTRKHAKEMLAAHR